VCNFCIGVLVGIASSYSPCHGVNIESQLIEKMVFTPAKIRERFASKASRQYRGFNPNRSLVRKIPGQREVGGELVWHGRWKSVLKWRAAVLSHVFLGVKT